MLFRLGYSRPLDGARAVAVIMVLGLHAGLPLMHGGAVGVDIFFVLSGLLITSILLEEWQLTKAISLKNFYFRRVLRLFPPFIVLLAYCELYACLALRGAERDQSQIAVLASLGYCANWRRALFGQDSMGPLLSHTWSSSIEEQFYLFWPPILVVLLRIRTALKQLVMVIFATVVIIWCYRATLWTCGAPWQRIFNGLDTRLDALLVGCGLASALSATLLVNPRFRRYLLASAIPSALLVLGILFWPLRPRYLCSWGWPVLECSIAVGILSLVICENNGVKIVFGSRPMAWVGRLSYSLYLWHFPVYEALRRICVRTPLLQISQVAMAFFAASMSYYIIEKPFLRMKKRLTLEASHKHQRFKGILSSEGNVCYDLQ